MHNKNDICEKIRSLYKDFGQGESDVEVAFDDAEQVWTVDLTKGSHHLKTFLVTNDVDACMAGKQCIGLGIQIGELRSNIDRR